MNEPTVYSVLTNFAKYKNDFFVNFNGLKNVKNVPSNLQNEQQRLLSVGSAIKIRLERITQALDRLGSYGSNVKTWVGSWFDVSSSLSAVPLVLVGVGVVFVSGTIVLVTKWMKDVYTFSQNIKEQQRLERSGLTPQQAAEVISKRSSEKSLFGDIFGEIPFGKILLVAGVLGVAYFYATNAGRDRYGKN